VNKLGPASVECGDNNPLGAQEFGKMRHPSFRDVPPMYGKERPHPYDVILAAKIHVAKLFLREDRPRSEVDAQKVTPSLSRSHA